MVNHQFYTDRITEFRSKADELQKKEARLSVSRLITFLAGLVLFFVLTGISAFAVLIAFMVVFGWLVIYHSRVEKMRNHYRYLQIINERELECISGRFDQFPDGSAYINTNHENSFDLDLFGRASLYQFINRTTSKPAADLLSTWLQHPASEEEIYLRQQAVTELKEDIGWRQDLISFGYGNREALDDPKGITGWIKTENEFKSPVKQRVIILLLGSSAILSTAATIIFSLPFSLLVIVYLINFIYYFSQAAKIGRIHNRLGKTSEMLKSYSSIINHISSRSFESPLLKSLHEIFIGRINVSKEIGLLSRLVNRLDTRLNVMVSIPLNLYFFWDIRCCLELEKWKHTNGSEIETWISGMAQFEVISSYSNMAFNNPNWTMPVVVPEYFQLEAKNAGHPLIPSDRRILNDIRVEGTGRTVIITGSNMSGKSTFLRMIGVNTVLALSGAPVCAESFTVSHVRIFSNMRISDSLEDNTSSFYAELKKLSSIIKATEKDSQLLLLLDEILRGTNSNDRYTGSVALLRQLNQYGNVTLIATHDLKLAAFAKEIPDKIDNYHFDVKIEGEELYFDYRLNKGICNSMNASLLMKKMGIKL